MQSFLVFMKFAFISTKDTLIKILRQFRNIFNLKENLKLGDM